MILPMSREDMADDTGLTIETISRMLGRLQADGVIEVSGSPRYRVRRPGLWRVPTAASRIRQSVRTTAPRRGQGRTIACQASPGWR